MAKDAKQDFIRTIVEQRHGSALGISYIEEAADAIRENMGVNGNFGVTLTLLSVGIDPRELADMAVSIGKVLQGFPRNPVVADLDDADPVEQAMELVKQMANAGLYGEEIQPSDPDDAEQFANHYIREARRLTSGDPRPRE